MSKESWELGTCEACYEEMIGWDEETHYEKVLVMYQKTRRPFDPKFERNRKRRRNEKGSRRRYNKENTYNQELSWRMYRYEMKDHLRHERYEMIRPFQKTQGWMTW